MQMVSFVYNSCTIVDILIKNNSLQNGGKIVISFLHDSTIFFPI